MAVEYDISSDVAVIKETGSVSQCARVTQMYSGQITYDDEAGSKFATATINGKSQRVMLCIAVNGTVTYDDVPSLYSTVDGHRCLNIVTPTETGTPDDVPSLYETVVIDGQNVRAVRCIMINKTPVYDGVSSTCTFTGDDGKTHTAQLVNKITGGSVEVIIKGTSPLNLPDAIANSLSYVKAFGGTEQRNLPDGYIERQFIYMMSGSYLLTNIVPTYDGKVEMDFQTTSIPSASMYLLGGRTEVYGGLFLAKSTGVTVDAFGTGSGDCYTSSVPFSNNTRYKFIFDNKVATLESGGTTLFTNTMTGTTANGASLVINGLNSNGNITGGQAGIYLYSFKMWNAQGELVANYVPAVQKGTVPVVGFYDTVSGTFKTATAGTFAAGGEAVPTPDTPVDIVSNNGVLKVSPNIIDTSLTREIGYSYWTGHKNEMYFTNCNSYNSVVGGYISASGFWNASAYGFNIPCVAGDVLRTKGYTGAPSRTDRRYYAFVDNDGLILEKNAWDNDTVIVAPANTVAVLIEWSLDDTNISGWLITKNSPLPTNYMPYGTIYTDGTVETINVHGTNIFNKNDTASIGNWYASTALKITSAGANQTLVMRAKPGATYYYKHCSVTGGGRAFYTEVEDWDIGSDCSAMVGATTIDKDEVRSITVSENAKWVFFIYGRSGQTATFEEQLADYMVSLTPLTSDTQYTPYYDGGTATAEMLLKVGDYQDEQEIISGIVTRNVGVLVLDGTENWTYSTTYSNTYPTFWLVRGVLDDASIANSEPAILYCSHFLPAPKSAANLSPQNNTASLGSNAHTAHTLWMRTSLYTDVSEFKQWLAAQYVAGTPVTVYYPLATPTTESVAGQTLQVTDGDNVLEITQASLTGLELEARYDAAVTLTVQEAEDANLDNNVTVTIQ